MRSGTGGYVTARRDVICILGMHSSGTSPVAAVLQALGVDLGAADQFLPVAADNQKGFYENSDFVDVNETLLARLGGTWREPPKMPAGWEGRRRFVDLERRAQAVIDSQFEGRERWGWKDPRNSLTLPFWQRVVPEARYVISVRHPVAVARSLGGSLSISTVAELWTRYMTAALWHTAGRERLFIFYEDLMRQAPVEVERLAAFLSLKGAPLPAVVEQELASAVDLSLWHFRDPDALERDEPRDLLKAQILYSALRTAADMDVTAGGVLEAVASAVTGEPTSPPALPAAWQAQAMRGRKRLEGQVAALSLQVRKLTASAAAAPAVDAEAILRADLRHRLGLDVERKAAPAAAVAAKPGAPPAPGTSEQQYADLVRRIRAFVDSALPASATIAVVSRGDDELLKLGSRRAWHFPQDRSGAYAGHHPATARDAIDLVEAAREKGATHLLFPATTRWWLDHYSDLAVHLKTKYSVTADQQGVCVIFALAAPTPRPVVPVAVNERYEHLVRQVRLVVEATLPSDADVLVVSKGDGHLLELGPRHARHFPQTADGVYAGHHPATGAAAIEHLRALYADGARFLVLPSIAFWWLDHYKDFAAHLAQNHRLVARQENVAFIYELLEPRVAGEPVPNPVSTTTRNPSRLLPRPAPRRPKRDAVRRGPHGKGARGLKDKFPG